MKEKYDNVVGEKEGGRREGGMKEEWREEGRKGRMRVRFDRKKVREGERVKKKVNKDKE